MLKASFGAPWASAEERLRKETVRFLAATPPPDYNPAEPDVPVQEPVTPVEPCGDALPAANLQLPAVSVQSTAVSGASASSGGAQPAPATPVAVPAVSVQSTAVPAAVAMPALASTPTTSAPMATDSSRGEKRPHEGDSEMVGATLHEVPDYEALWDIDWDAVNKTGFANADVCAGKIEGLKAADEFGIYSVVPTKSLSADAKKVDTKWDIKISKGRVKCRIVGREFRWLEQRDDTFAPTSGNRTSRVVDFEALKADTDENDPMVCFEADCCSAFYQTPEEEDFYCLPPKEWLMAREAAGESTDVMWKLEKQLPGRRLAAVKWVDFVATEFSQMGLSAYPGSPHLFASLDEGRVLIDTHMDDFHGCARRSRAQVILAELRERFKLKDSDCIEEGVYEHLKRTRVKTKDGTLIVGNGRHVEHLVKELGLENAKPVPTPSIKFVDPANSPLLAGQKKSTFGTCVGILVYYCFDRIDIKREVMLLTRRVREPRECDYELLKRVGRYLKGVPEVGVWLSKPTGNKDVVQLAGWVDTDWAQDEEDRKSVTCQIIEADGCELNSLVARQALMAQSSGEAEFIGMHGVSLEMKFFKNFFQWMGYRVEWKILSDSAAAKAMAQRQGVGKVRHLDLRTLWVQDLVKYEHLRIVKCKGLCNKADIGTKVHPVARFRELCEFCGLRRTAEVQTNTNVINGMVGAATVNGVIGAASRHCNMDVSVIQQALATLLVALGVQGSTAQKTVISEEVAGIACTDGFCTVTVKLTDFIGFVLAILLVIAVCIFIMRKTSTPRTSPLPEEVRGTPPPVQRFNVMCQSMVTYKRKWAKPEFRCLPEGAHG